MEFTALQDFDSEELGSRYLAGMSYTARPVTDAEPPRVQDLRAKLLELLPQWIEEGKVAPGRSGAVVKGH